MRAVFLDLQTFNRDISLAKVTEHVDSLVTYQLTSPEQIVERCLDAEIIITNKVVLTQKVIAQLPQLKLICIAATGTNNVDIAAAKKANIAVTNVSGYAGNSITQYVFAQLLDYFGQTSHYQQYTEQGLWQQSATFCHQSNTITELANKTIGIIGYGDLGESVAKVATAFNMRTLIAERQHSINIRENRFSFEYVIENADILSLHCPQTAETENLINNTILSKMKRSAVLINTARGAIVNNQDLHHALKTNDIAYAILDVLEQEPPPPEHVLLKEKLNNLKITPHIAWASIEAQQRLLDKLAENISSYGKNERLNRVD